jgi:hypothetical protein
MADRAMKVENALWANGNIYSTIITDTSFKPARNPASTDTLVNFDMSGLTGQRAVAAAAPGERDYNGGRWVVQLAFYTPAGIAHFDPDGDGKVNYELTSDDEVHEAYQSGYIDLMDTDVSFECPLI